jgi:hypothetical protein
VVAVLLNVPLQALNPVLLLLASPGPGSGAAEHLPDPPAPTEPVLSPQSPW